MRQEQLMSAIEVLRYRYRRFNKKRKGEILAELEKRFSVNRKYLVRLLARKTGGRPKTPSRTGRPSKYGDPSFQAALRKLRSLCAADIFLFLFPFGRGHLKSSFNQGT